MKPTQTKILGILISALLVIVFISYALSLNNSGDTPKEVSQVTTIPGPTVVPSCGYEYGGGPIITYEYFDTNDSGGKWKSRTVVDCKKEYYVYQETSFATRGFKGPFPKDDSFSPATSALEYIDYVNPQYGLHFKVPRNFIIANKSSNDSLNLAIKNGVDGDTYLRILAFKGDLMLDKDLQGPYPKTIPPNEKNSTLTIVQKALNGIVGVEQYGWVDEGHDYADTFSFQKDEYVWHVGLNHIGEGKINAKPESISTPWETSSGLNKEVYFLIRDSLRFDQRWIDTYIQFNTASSSDGTHTISCRALPETEEEHSYFGTPKELVVTDSVGHEMIYENPTTLCPFKWVRDTVYGAGSSYESAADLYKMKMVDGNTPGAITSLGFDSHGNIDPTGRYYAFTNVKENRDGTAKVLFCATGSELPSWQESDQLGVIDFQTGETTILRAEPGKIYDPEGWSGDSRRILYREYDKQQDALGKEHFCPSYELGVQKRYSIDIFTKEVRKEEGLRDVYIPR